MTDPEMKACPWCGTAPEAIDGAPTQFSSWVGCRHAFCSVTPFVDAASFGEAVEIWNTRTPDLEASIARLVEALRQWKCPACGGSGVYKDKSMRTGEFVEAEVPCKVCEKTGLHPVARQAIVDQEGK